MFAALTSILAKSGIEGVDSNLATAIRTVVVVLMAWGIVFLTHAQSGLSEIRHQLRSDRCRNTSDGFISNGKTGS